MQSEGLVCMMYDEMLTLICLSIEICVLSTEEACCPFLGSFLDLEHDQFALTASKGKNGAGGVLNDLKWSQMGY